MTDKERNGCAQKAIAEQERSETRRLVACFVYCLPTLIFLIPFCGGWSLLAFVVLVFSCYDLMFTLEHGAHDESDIVMITLVRVFWVLFAIGISVYLHLKK